MTLSHYLPAAVQFATMSGRVLVGVKRVIDYAVKVTPLVLFLRPSSRLKSFSPELAHLTFRALLADVSLLTPAGWGTGAEQHDELITRLTDNLPVCGQSHRSL